MSIIAQVHAREILDSRGNPTVEAEVVLPPHGRARLHGEIGPGFVCVSAVEGSSPARRRTFVVDVRAATVARTEEDLEPLCHCRYDESSCALFKDARESLIDYDPLTGARHVVLPAPPAG